MIFLCAAQVARLTTHVAHKHKQWQVCLLLRLQALAPSYEPEVWQQLNSTAAANSSSSSSAARRPNNMRLVPGPPKPLSQQQQQHQQQQQQAGPAPSGQPEPQQQAAQALQVEALPPSSLANAILAHKEQGTSSSNGGSCSNSTCRQSALRLSVKFRAHKKMLLADVLLASPVPLEQLMRQTQLLQAFKAASAAARLSPSRVDKSMSEDALPWH